MESILNRLEALNNQIFLTINAPAGSTPWLVDIAKVLGDGLIYLIPLGLVILWLQGGTAKRNLALRAFAVAMLAVGLNQIIGLIWQHPRPFMVGLGHAWIDHAPDSSFPSDHATVFFSLGFAFLAGRAFILASSAACCGLLVAWARILLGVHFPMDMAGGALVAYLASIVVSPVWSYAGLKATDLAETTYRAVFHWPISSGWIRR